MDPTLILPPDFTERAAEVEAKGVLWDAHIVRDGKQVPVTFYDPVRLAQDIDADIDFQRAFITRRLIVVQRVTIEEMSRAVTNLPADFLE